MIKGFILSMQSFYNENDPITVFVGLCCAIFFNIQALFYGVILAVILNSLSGIWKSSIQTGRFNITARGLRRTIEKVGGYGITIVTFGILDVLVIQISNQKFIITISMVVAGMIILYEGLSISRNLKDITGMNLFMSIYDAVQNAFRRRIYNDDLSEKGKKRKRTTITTIEEDE